MLRIILMLICMPGMLLPGCAKPRSFYRQQADSEVYSLINEKNCGEIATEQLAISPHPMSRMYDPFSQDCPPMPSDDPRSHQLMHCVDCREGYACWHHNGDRQQVENQDWWQHILDSYTGEDGIVRINIEDAMRLALVNSPAYQREVEELYLSALEVSFQRFQFDGQYFAGYAGFLTGAGPNNRFGNGNSASTSLDFGTFSAPGSNRLRREQLFSDGTQLIVGLANSLMWEFAGSNTHMATTLLDFSLVQPLLRNGGRDVVLEALTQSERNLLANVRQMERFRRSFYVEIFAGRNSDQGPSPTGVPLLGLNGQTTTAGNAGGYLGILQSLQDIRNQRSNIASLQSSVAQLEAFFLAGRIDFFQVELARQALFSGQSRLLNSERALEAQLDAFKILLGLPPYVELEFDQEIIEPFQLVDPEIVPLQTRLTRLQQKVGETMSRLFANATLPRLERRETREELPAPGVARLRTAKEKAARKNGAIPNGESNGEKDGDDKDAEDKSTSEGSGNADKPDADPTDDLFLLDRMLGANAGNADDSDDDGGKSDSGAENAGADDNTNRNANEDDDEEEAEDAIERQLPALEWSESTAKELQTLKQQVSEAIETIGKVREKHTPVVERDVQQLRQSTRKRTTAAESLRERIKERLESEKEERGLDEITESDIEGILPFNENRLEKLPVILDDTMEDIGEQFNELEELLTEIDEELGDLLEKGKDLKPTELYKRLQDKIRTTIPDNLNILSATVLSLTLVEARARTETVSIGAPDTNWQEALNTARHQRLDWMNARASLVDTWRQIQFTANDLESQLDFIVEGDLGNVGDNPLDINFNNSRLRFGLEFDAPLTRLQERNTFRESQIEYQRARRAFYQFEDGVAFSLRDIIRRQEVNQIDFELQRAAVEVAISQVELARLRLQEPPRPNEEASFGATTARDLVQALAGLLSAQNDFLDVWVRQEVLRRFLDLDRGTMRLSPAGMWIDPTDEINPLALQSSDSGEQFETIPLPDPDPLDSQPDAEPLLLEQAPKPEDLPPPDVISSRSGIRTPAEKIRSILRTRRGLDSNPTPAMVTPATATAPIANTANDPTGDSIISVAQPDFVQPAIYDNPIVIPVNRWDGKQVLPRSPTP